MVCQLNCSSQAKPRLAAYRVRGFTWGLARGLNNWFFFPDACARRATGKLEKLVLVMVGLGDEGMRVLCASLGPGSLPHLAALGLRGNGIGPAGATAFAAALSKGAMLRLGAISMGCNHVRDEGIAALAVPLRRRPLFKMLLFNGCDMTDAGVAALFADLSPGMFKQLETLWLDGDNEVSDAGANVLISIIDGGRLPNINKLQVDDDALNDDTMLEKLKEAVERAKTRKAYATGK